MEYQIREIAEMFNISRQMVRYYEQNGVITPKRKTDNNYRVYGVLDYFSLGEAIALSRFNINIKDIGSLSTDDYSKKICDCYRKYIRETENELAYKGMLKERAQELLIRTENAELNVGNIWVKRVPGYILYPLVESHNDEYDPVLTPKEVRNVINSAEIVPFGDAFIELKDGYERWWSGFQERYAKHLEIPACEACKRVPEHYSVCLIINMGDIGEFYANTIRDAAQEILQMDYKFKEKPRGLLLFRGLKNNEFQRLLEIQIPIEKP